MSHLAKTAAAAFVAAASGDHTAYHEFYDFMAPMVYGLCHRITHNRAHAESAAQDVFVDLWRMAPTFDPLRHDIRSWSSAIAYRRAVDRVHAMAPDGVDDAADFDSRLVLTRRRDAPGIVTLRLPAEYRTALDLLICRGSGLQAVAEQLGVTVAEAAAVVTAALRQARDAFDELDAQEVVPGPEKTRNTPWTPT